jgi:hypothetical protein
MKTTSLELTRFMQVLLFFSAANPNTGNYCINNISE